MKDLHNPELGTKLQHLNEIYWHLWPTAVIAFKTAYRYLGDKDALEVYQEDGHPNWSALREFAESHGQFTSDSLCTGTWSPEQISLFDEVYKTACSLVNINPNP